MPNDLVEFKENVRITRQGLMAKVGDWLKAQERTPVSVQQFLSIIQASDSPGMLQNLGESGFLINRYDSYSAPEAGNYLRRVYTRNEGSDPQLQKFCDILNAFELLFRIDELLIPIECCTNFNDLELSLMIAEHAQLQASKAPDRPDICEKYRLQGVDALETYKDSLQFNQNILDAAKTALKQRAQDMQDALLQLVKLLHAAYVREPNTSYLAHFFSSYWQLIWESAGNQLFKASIYHSVAKNFQYQATSMTTKLCKSMAQAVTEKQQRLDQLDQVIQTKFDDFAQALQAKLSRSGVNETLLLERPLADPVHQSLRNSNPLHLMVLLMRTSGFGFRFFPEPHTTGLLVDRPESLAHSEQTSSQRLSEQ